MRFIGLDVHRTFAAVAVLEDGGVDAAGRVPTTALALEACARTLRPNEQVVRRGDDDHARWRANPAPARSARRDRQPVAHAGDRRGEDQDGRGRRRGPGSDFAAVTRLAPSCETCYRRAHEDDDGARCPLEVAGGGACARSRRGDRRHQGLEARRPHRALRGTSPSAPRPLRSGCAGALAEAVLEKPSSRPIDGGAAPARPARIAAGEPVSRHELLAQGALSRARDAPRDAARGGGGARRRLGPGTS